MDITISYSMGSTNQRIIESYSLTEANTPYINTIIISALEALSGSLIGNLSIKLRNTKVNPRIKPSLHKALTHLPYQSLHDS